MCFAGLKNAQRGRFTQEIGVDTASQSVEVIQFIYSFANLAVGRSLFFGAFKKSGFFGEKTKFKIIKPTLKPNAINKNSIIGK